MQRSKYAMLIWNRSGFIDRITGQENHGREPADSVNLFVGCNGGQVEVRFSSEIFLRNKIIFALAKEKSSIFAE